jgi:glycosyltransferase involved in cell wall biosynthesis
MDLAPFVGREPAVRAHGEPFRLLAAGRLVDGKGFDRLLDAVRLLRERGAAVLLDIAGDGPARPALERRAGEGVRFLGACAHADMAARYADAHGFAFPTRRDVWGYVLMEAMAAGLPVLTAREAGAARDLVVPGRTGAIVDFDDAAAVAAQLEAWIAEPMEARALGRAARNRVQAHFGLDAHAEAWLEMLERW